MKKERIEPVVTPIGYISYPFLDAPDTGRPNSSGKYTAQLFISKEEWKKSGKPLVEAIKKAGSQLLGKQCTLADFKHTIYDVDKLPADKREKLPEAVRIGFMKINSASARPPIVKDAKLNVMTSSEIQKIEGGALCRFVVAPYTYNQSGGGVALGLNVVQYQQKSELKFGGGGAGAELLTSLTVDTSELDTEEDTSSEQASNVTADNFEDFD